MEESYWVWKKFLGKAQQGAQKGNTSHLATQGLQSLISFDLICWDQSDMTIPQMLYSGKVSQSINYCYFIFIIKLYFMLISFILIIVLENINLPPIHTTLWVESLILLMFLFNLNFWKGCPISRIYIRDLGPRRRHTAQNSKKALPSKDAHCFRSPLFQPQSQIPPL